MLGLYTTKPSKPRAQPADDFDGIFNSAAGIGLNNAPKSSRPKLTIDTSPGPFDDPTDHTNHQAWSFSEKTPTPTTGANPFADPKPSNRAFVEQHPDDIELAEFDRILDGLDKLSIPNTQGADQPIKKTNKNRKVPASQLPRQQQLFSTANLPASRPSLEDLEAGTSAFAGEFISNRDLADTSDRRTRCRMVILSVAFLLILAMVVGIPLAVFIKRTRAYNGGA